MKKMSFFGVFLLLTVFSCCAQANFTVNCWCPPPSNCICDGATTRVAPSVLDSLEHGNFYLWKIENLSIPAGEHITEAGLLFKGINNWREPQNDVLYIQLLSNSEIGDAKGDLDMWKIATQWHNGQRIGRVYKGEDDPDAENDFDREDGYGVLLDEYRDENGNWCWNPPENYCYEFTDEQIGLVDSYIRANGVIGIGLDSDCWYRPHTDTDWIKFWYCTAPTIPAPGAVILGGIGVGLVGWLRRRRSL